ncbi:MAG: hypothetical protein NZM11_02345 [Anaerolineales bacterium]|nr:hypothetical protein [Anaerolineales bacterium]
MFPLAIRRRFHSALEHSQLLILRQVISFNRSVRRARRWLQPVESWLWLMPAAFLLGMVGVILIRLG